MFFSWRRMYPRLSGAWCSYFFFFFQAEDGIRDDLVTGVQTLLFRSRFKLRPRSRFLPKLKSAGQLDFGKRGQLAENGSSRTPVFLPWHGRFTGFTKGQNVSATPSPSAPAGSATHCASIPAIARPDSCCRRRASALP